MKKIVFIFFACIVSGRIFSQEIISANKELLGQIPIGDGNGKIIYRLNDEYDEIPYGPAVSKEGKLYFFPSYKKNTVLVFENGKLIERSTPPSLPLDEITNRQFSSQKGMILTPTGCQLLITDKLIYYYSYYKIINRYYDQTSIYAAPFGAILYAEGSGDGIAVTFNTDTPSMEYDVIPENMLKKWLPTQQGGFSIGEDGLLYRNGILWSAAKKPTYGKYEYEYRGRLISGHILWSGGGRLNSPGQFIISDTRGNVEVVIDLPWRKAVENEWYQYNYGVGPWGEIYFLLPPSFIPVGAGKSGDGIKYNVYGPDPSKPAELVVVRNYLKYFGRLNDDKVRLRKGPSTATESLGIYPVKTGFRILEKGTAEETIGGQKNVWYKVRLLDGTEGWFFGAFVHNLYDGPNGNPPPWPNVADW
ncbi:MAG: SH3 domain-containing protein [Treponema sp.]|nr:SH3 domain-containing protein [Treponema sp.]